MIKWKHELQLQQQIIHMQINNSYQERVIYAKQ